MHWADVAASKINEPAIISTAISPSGEIHVGNMREVLTGELIYRALSHSNKKATFYYEADDMDPLRKVPNGIDGSFSKYIGRPLFKTPAPDNKHSSWSDQFIEPFVETMKLVGANPRFLKTHELYEQGLFNDAIKTAMDKRKQIATILAEVSGKQITGEYYPFNVECESCGRIDKTVIENYEWPYVGYKCESCGHTGKRDIRNGNGKLPWRVEWPAKWLVLGVTVEPFGKDHASAGGSYDTGKRIAREVFNIEPPFPLVYEWIHLRGMGAMHSSKGILIRAIDMVRMVPPEVLRFLIAKNNPERHIEMDTGRGLISLVNEYDAHERVYFGLEKGPDPERAEDMKRIYELSQVGSIPTTMPVQVSFSHIINLIQLKKNNEEIIQSLKRSGYNLSGDLSHLYRRIEAAKFWLANFAPDEFKIKLINEPFPMELKDDEKRFLSLLENNIMGDLTPDQINKVIHDSCNATIGNQEHCFKLVYKIFLGKESGPRLGYLFTSMDKEFIRSVLKYYTG